MEGRALLIAFVALCAVAAQSDVDQYEFGFSRTNWGDSLTSQGYGGRRLFQGGYEPSVYSSPPPPFEGGQAGDPNTCNGVAYDGYLSNCHINFFAPSDTSYVNPLITVAVTEGAFATGLTADQLGGGYLVPAPSNTPLVAVPHGQTPSFCYDNITRLPEILPLATPPPTDCDTNIIVVDIASSVLQYGLQYNVQSVDGQFLDQSTLKGAFGFPNSIVIGQYDAIKAAKSTDAATSADGLTALKAIAYIRSWATIISQGITKSNSDNFAGVAKQVLLGLAQYVVDTRTDRLNQAQQTNSTRRLASTSNEVIVYLNVTSELQALFNTVETRIAQAIDDAELDSGDVAPISTEVQQAVNQAVATINSITGNQTNFNQVQQAIQVVMTSLTTAVLQLVAGTISVDQFNQATTESVLSHQVSTATLEGNVVPPSGDGGSNKGALIGGLVGGLGGGLLLLSALAFFIVYRRRRNSQEPRQE